jgi:hypothetical protein
VELPEILFLEGILKLAKLSGYHQFEGALEYTFITIALLEADDPQVALEVIAAVMFEPLARWLYA